ncbi:hypothetical protein [Ruminococcus sp.]|uniref:hypothetical protein n=1 Tax=Ruminococcus sp. TaxID=41978 RepID=UPI003F0E72A6
MKYKARVKNMDVNNILRLAIILSDNQATTFKSNLKKIVKLVLTDCYPKGMNSYKISSYIRDNYSLNFLYKEIEDALNKDKSIICINNNGTKEYQLTPEEYQKYADKNQSILDALLLQFLKNSKMNNKVSFEKCKDIIFRFFYYTFNSDVQTLLLLLNKKSDEAKNFCDEEKFNCEEATLINDFLNWNNREKNELILNLISSCYDYCMLTVKKDDRSYESVFNNKTFYLDSNVIFRLAGFNKKERQDVMQAFIHKCESAGIKIKYTNFTKEEIKSTIKHNVNIISKTFGHTTPIAPEAVSILDSQYSSFDFYEKYYEWTSKLNNSPGDFQSFERYLNKQIEKCCKNFEMEVFESYNTIRNRENFEQKCNEFSKFKKERYRATNKKAIETDINNYFYLLDKKNNGKANSFTELNSFFITADHCLTEWTLQIRAGSIPIFVLPSVWYSILLKYKGRAENDYEAFCKFLNIRIAPESDELYYNKTIMLAKVLELSEPREIKEEIIYDINSKLSEFTVEDNPEDIVKKSVDSVTKKYVDEAVKKVNDANAERISKLSEEYENQKTDKYDEGKSSGYELGVKEEKERQINKRTNKVVRRNKHINIVLLVVCVLFVLVFLFALLAGLFKDSINNNSQLMMWVSNNSIALQIIASVISVLSGLLKHIFSKIDVFSEKRETIYAREKRKYEKD